MLVTHLLAPRGKPSGRVPWIMDQLIGTRFLLVVRSLDCKRVCCTHGSASMYPSHDDPSGPRSADCARRYADPDSTFAVACSLRSALGLSGVLAFGIHDTVKR